MLSLVKGSKGLHLILTLGARRLLEGMGVLVGPRPMSGKSILKIYWRDSSYSDPSVCALVLGETGSLSYVPSLTKRVRLTVPYKAKAVSLD